MILRTAYHSIDGAELKVGGSVSVFGSIFTPVDGYDYLNRKEDITLVTPLRHLHSNLGSDPLYGNSYWLTFDLPATVP